MGEDGRDAAARSAFQGLLNIGLNKPNTKKYRDFEQEVRQANAKAPFFFTMDKTEPVSIEALYVHSDICRDQDNRQQEDLRKSVK